jgi:hypothetical protein
VAKANHLAARRRAARAAPQKTRPREWRERGDSRHPDDPALTCTLDFARVDCRNA